MYCTFCCIHWQLKEQLELAHKQEVDEMKSNLLSGKEKVLDLDSCMDVKCLGSTVDVLLLPMTVVKGRTNECPQARVGWPKDQSSG